MRELCLMEVRYVAGGKDTPAPQSPPSEPSKNGPESGQKPEQKQQADDGFNAFADFIGDIANGYCSLTAKKLGGVVICAAVGEAVSGAIKKMGEIDSEKHPLPQFPAH